MARWRIRERDRAAPTLEWRGFDPSRIVFPTWLVDGLIPEGSTCCIYGAPNTGKSFLVLDMALAIATGRKWLGLATRSEVGTTKERGKVVYILAEGPEGLNRRIAAWLQHQGTMWEDGVAELANHFFIPLIEHIHLDRPADLELVIALIKEKCPDVALIIFDPLVSFMAGDENSARDSQALITALRRIVETFKDSRCSVLMVHHTGKEGWKGERGSSALRGGVDAHLQLNDKGKLTVEKQRDAAKADTIYIDFRTVTVAAEDGNVDLGKVVVPGTPPQPRPSRREKSAPAAGSPVLEATTDGQEPPAPRTPPTKKQDPRQIRKARNHQTVLDVVRDLTRAGKGVTVAEVKGVISGLGNDKFSVSEKAVYDIMNAMAEPTDGSSPTLRKDGKKYSLIRRGATGDAENSVHFPTDTSQDGPSRPAEAAAPIEGQQP